MNAIVALGALFASSATLSAGLAVTVAVVERVDTRLQARPCQTSSNQPTRSNRPVCSFWKWRVSVAIQSEASPAPLSSLPFMDAIVALGALFARSASHSAGIAVTVAVVE